MQGLGRVEFAQDLQHGPQLDNGKNRACMSIAKRCALPK
jgi:hypothetical protein